MVHSIYRNIASDKGHNLTCKIYLYCDLKSLHALSHLIKFSLHICQEIFQKNEIHRKFQVHFQYQGHRISNIGLQIGQISSFTCCTCLYFNIFCSACKLVL
jgi:hypothetical protein